MHLASMESSSPTSRCHTRLLPVKGPLTPREELVAFRTCSSSVQKSDVCTTTSGSERRQARSGRGSSGANWAAHVPLQRPGLTHRRTRLGVSDPGRAATLGTATVGSYGPDQGLELTCRLPERGGQFWLVVAFPFPEPNLT